jgi:hypothetical protein
VTLGVAGLDALLERLAAQGIDHEPIESYSNGVRHTKVPDPDGNAIAFAELPDADHSVGSRQVLAGGSCRCGHLRSSLAGEEALGVRSAGEPRVQ